MGSDSFSTRAFLLFLISIFSLIAFANGQSPLYYFCGIETIDRDYKTILTSLLDSLSFDCSHNLFPPKNEVVDIKLNLYLCGGDVNATACQSCVKTAVQVIQECQYNKTAIMNA
ncbi:hypothetical protein CK203_027029 [Vitis vinifera]|uniref:Gnk2-homologous domain-containing protein n=1 Tax=Vitis vinifera TaxID=29760 RepID=A0A438HRW7_VITVI|nr:hypothetical protein CK203_027029 [Vitis vinifera]